MKGSGVDEWPCMKFVWVFKYILVHVYIGVPIKTFFVRKAGGGGGGVPSKILREYGFKKNFENYGRPLNSTFTFKVAQDSFGSNRIRHYFFCQNLLFMAQAFRK